MRQLDHAVYLASRDDETHVLVAARVEVHEALAAPGAPGLLQGNPHRLQRRKPVTPQVVEPSLAAGDPQPTLTVLNTNIECALKPFPMDVANPGASYGLTADLANDSRMVTFGRIYMLISRIAFDAQL